MKMLGSPGGTSGKASPASAGDIRDAGSISGLGKAPCRRAEQPTPVFLPGESPRTEKPGGLLSMGWQRVRHDWATKHSTESTTQSLLGKHTSQGSAAHGDLELLDIQWVCILVERPHPAVALLGSCCREENTGNLGCLS